MADRYSLAGLQAQVATLLDVQPDEVGPDESLLDLGLDSMRVLSLVEQWRADGVEVSFTDLAAEPTVAGWHRLLTAARS